MLELRGGLEVLEINIAIIDNLNLMSLENSDAKKKYGGHCSK
jgi:hypothetical protein